MMEGFTISLKNTFISISPSTTPKLPRSKTSPCSIDTPSSLLDDLDSYCDEIDMMSPQCSENRTTLMIRNVPNKYKRNQLLQEIGDSGFDFVYLPMSRKKAHMNLGYAFVNFESVELAKKFLEDFQDHQWSRCGKKPASVCYAEIQGFEANVEYFQEMKQVDAARKSYIHSI